MTATGNIAPQGAQAGSRFEAVCAWLLFGLVALAPLPLGSNRLGPSSVLALLAGALLAAWAIHAIFRRDPPARLWPGTRFIPLLYGLAVAWAAIQLYWPVPPAIAHPAWEIAASELGSAGAPVIALTPYEGGAGLMRMLAYGGIFWLAVQYGANARRARAAMRAFAIAGLAYAIYGLAVQLSGSNSILWFEKWAYPDALTSTFVNRNSYATYAGLGLVCAAGLLFEAIGRVLAVPANWRTKAGFVIEEVLGRSAVLVIAIVAMLTALLLTGSRGGTLSTLVGLAALAIGAAYAGILRRGHAVALGTAMLTAAVAVFTISGKFVADRIAGGSQAADGRLAIHRITLDAIGDAPLVGTGLGSYPAIYRIYENELERMPAKPNHAHNSYLEEALELGVAGAAALLGALTLIALACLRGIRERRRDRSLPLIGAAASVLAGVHAFFDFSLEIPAVAATFAFVMGIAYAQSFSTRAAH